MPAHQALELPTRDGDAEVGFFSTSGVDMFAPLGIAHPLVATLAALVLGGLFGLLSSIVGAALTRKSVAEVS